MKQVIIEMNDGTIIVMVDGKRINFMEDSTITKEERLIIQKKVFEIEHRLVSRSVFKI